MTGRVTNNGETQRSSPQGDLAKYLSDVPFYSQLSVHLSRSNLFGPAVFVILIAVVVLAVAQFPTLSVGGWTIQTPLLGGLVSGILLVPSIVSHYRSGEQRATIRWALFAVGIPLSLTQRSPFDWVGIVAVVLSLAVAWEIERRLLPLTSQ